VTVLATIKRMVPDSVKDRLRTAPPAPASPPPGGQTGEVDVLRDLIKPEFPKSLVDIGAHDGITDSNSRKFVLDGWRAILVEPHPDLCGRLREASAGLDARCVNVACSSTAGKLPLFMGKADPDTTMSTLCTDENPWWDAIRGDDSIEVDVRTLSDLFDESDWIGDFSLLLVDTEGMDYEVLQGLDFDRWRPRIIVTEEYISNPAKHRAKYRLLMEKGYTFHSMVGCNTIWIANEWVEVCLGLSASQ
jgi:FkbM family methyltransferase